METISKVLPLLAGIGMFLYGMNLMASSIEKLAGAKLERTMERFTDNRWKGLLLGTGVTAIIQSSAATSITMIGFVNAGIMTLAQTIPVIWGANIGSTATAQLLRLGDLSGGDKLTYPVIFYHGWANDGSSNFHKIYRWFSWISMVSDSMRAL